jgi:hypothetical protein
MAGIKTRVQAVLVQNSIRILGPQTGRGPTLIVQACSYVNRLGFGIEGSIID